MKTFFKPLVLAGCLATLGTAVVHSAQHKDHQHKPAASSAAHKDAGAGQKAGLVKRGAPLSGDAPAVAFADVLKEPQKYAGKSVRIEGVVERVCKKEGCWMEIAPEKGEATVRVTFKNHGFFVPKDSNSMRFRAEGEFAVKKLSKEEVEHLVKEDGATIKTNADGTADEVSFVADGVELWKSE